MFLVVLVVFFTGFWYTGGKSLIDLYQHYLSKEIPDKTYGWDNFKDRGPGEMLSGYYAGADSSGFYMWTLSGLKRFTHKQETSVYYYLDTCGMIKQLEAKKDQIKQDEKIEIREEMYYYLETWTEKMKKGDYVWVLRVGEGKDEKVIDKVWGNSNDAFRHWCINRKVGVIGLSE